MNDWIKLAIGIWTVLFLTGLGMKSAQAVLDWAKRK